MKCIFSVFLLILFIVFTNIQCNVKWESVVSDRAELIRDILQNNLANKTNLTFVPITHFSSERNLSVDLDDELIDIDRNPVSDEERGRVCLKNITDCMEKVQTVNDITIFLNQDQGNYVKLLSNLINIHHSKSFEKKLSRLNKFLGKQTLCSNILSLI
ncbi:hypothetical protein JTB14_013597 [Gonioctena quinquepunctata]|nr:hypothetical protein JTB14_013597 [Gonioctena quinquepunctata]